MTSIRILAAELKLSRVSVREWCKGHGITVHPRLPRGAAGGQTEGHIDDHGAMRVRDRYSARVADLRG